jgi:hypothetical protein
VGTSDRVVPEGSHLLLLGVLVRGEFGLMLAAAALALAAPVVWLALGRTYSLAPLLLIHKDGLLLHLGQYLLLLLNIIIVTSVSAHSLAFSVVLSASGSTSRVRLGSLRLLAPAACVLLD